MMYASMTPWGACVQRLFLFRDERELQRVEHDPASLTPPVESVVCM